MSQERMKKEWSVCKVCVVGEDLAAITCSVWITMKLGIQLEINS